MTDPPRTSLTTSPHPPKKCNMTGDMWHLTPVMWHLTCDTCGEGETFFKNYGSLVLIIWECRCFEDLHETDRLLKKVQWQSAGYTKSVNYISCRLCNNEGKQKKAMRSIQQEAGTRQGGDNRLKNNHPSALSMNKQTQIYVIFGFSWGYCCYYLHIERFTVSCIVISAMMKAHQLGFISFQKSC